MSELQSENDREEIKYLKTRNYVEGRLGYFGIHNSWLFTSIYKDFMRSVIVVKAESTFQGQTLYTGFHPHFDIVEDGYVHPLYVMSVNKFGGQRYFEQVKDHNLVRYNARYYLDLRNPHGED